MEIRERGESNLQEFTPNIDTHEYEDNDEIIRNENTHPEIYEREENPPISTSDYHDEALNYEDQQNIEPKPLTTTPQLNNLEYENVKVSFPISTEGTINSHMVYKIKYTWQGKDFVVQRRFSDFSSLRESLRKYLPCHYIFPVHKKQTMVGLQG